jgi:UDP-N-acetyl-2-amino-2-deoxyglucuronate dehydrogenase
MTEKIKFAVLGAGHIGKRHAAMIQQHPEATLVAMIDTDTRLQKELETTFQVPFFASYEAFLQAQLSTDVVNIATPNHLHAPQAITALANGCHVVCEKPMALRKSDAEDVLFAALQAHKLVFCVMQNRYSPPSEWLKEVVSSGILGKIFMVQINCYWNRDDRYYKKDGWKGKQLEDGGTLFTQFSHFIDIMFWLFGDIQNIQGKFNDFNHQHSTDFEDSGFVSFDFKKGGMGCINYSTAVWDKNLESSITIIAEKGSIKVGGQYMDKVEYCHIQDYTMPELRPSNPPNDYGAYKGSAANHHYIIENVVDTLRGRNIATTNALEGLKVVEIIENIYQLKKTSKG